MSERYMLVDREALRAELRRAFDEPTAAVLLDVLERVAAEVREGAPTRDDFALLRQAVEQLAAAQVRSEERLAGVEDRLTSVEDRLTSVEDRLTSVEDRLTSVEDRLTRVEDRLERVEDRLERVEDRLARLEEGVAEARRDLMGAIERLAKQVGGLSETVGGDIEDMAYIVLYDVLRREYGWDVGVLGRSWQMWGDELEEIDVFGKATDPARPNTPIWIVGEARHNLTVTEVDRFAGKVQRARRFLAGDIFPVCFCYRARPEVQRRVHDAGLRLLFSYGRFGD